VVVVNKTQTQHFFCIQLKANVAAFLSMRPSSICVSMVTHAHMLTQTPDTYSAAIQLLEMGAVSHSASLQELARHVMHDEQALLRFQVRGGLCYEVKNNTYIYNNEDNK